MKLINLFGRRIVPGLLVAILATSSAWALDCATNPDEDGDGWDAKACGGFDCDDSDPGLNDPDIDGDGENSYLCGGNDCNDFDPERFPGNAEVCDLGHVDEDCNLSTPGLRDADGDGFNDATCINFFPNGEVASQGDDCDDGRPSVHRIATEICDGLDNNCDGDVDGDAMIQQWVDLDLDGHGNPNDPMRACPETAGYSVLPNDCFDGNPAIQPGAQVCVEGAPEALLVCDSSGQWTPMVCGENQVCVTQINGTGACLDSGEKDVKKPKA